MNRRLMSVAAVFVALVGIANAQAKPLAGSDAIIGKPARVGPYQMILTAARFDTRVFVKDDAWVAPKGKKYLILSFTIQNPGKSDVSFERQSLKFTVVATDGANYDTQPCMVNPATYDNINLDIKPVQKVPAMVFAEVPNSDPVYKVIVRHGDDPVLRYDLRGKVSKYAGLFATKDGVTLSDTAISSVGLKIESGYFNVSVDSVEESNEAIGSYAPEDGKKLVVLHVTFTNATFNKHTLEKSTYEWNIFDADGDKFEFSEALIKNSSTDTVSVDIEPGASLKTRLIFYAPKAAKAASIMMRVPEGRSVTVPIK